MFKINYQNKSGFLAETHKTMGESRNNNEKKCFKFSVAQRMKLKIILSYHSKKWKEISQKKKKYKNNSTLVFL